MNQLSALSKITVISAVRNGPHEPSSSPVRDGVVFGKPLICSNIPHIDQVRVFDWDMIAKEHCTVLAQWR